jgi:AraC family transcriptional regulator
MKPITVSQFAPNDSPVFSHRAVVESDKTSCYITQQIDLLLTSNHDQVRLMQNRIETIASKTLIGQNQKMCLAQNMTPQLFQGFMPRKKEIEKRSNGDSISMQVFDHSQDNIFAPTAMFDKWAAVEVDDAITIPDGMQSYSLPGGQYAVFIHQGPVTAFAKTMQYIFTQWLPNSEYELDNREHFEVLPEGYKPMDPQATEEVWIPIKPKTT